jgi:hypothetical protein
MTRLARELSLWALWIAKFLTVRTQECHAARRIGHCFSQRLPHTILTMTRTWGFYPDDASVSTSLLEAGERFGQMVSAAGLGTTSTAPRLKASLTWSSSA